MRLHRATGTIGSIGRDARSLYRGRVDSDSRSHRSSPNFFGGDSNYPILPAHLLARFSSLNHVDYGAAPVGSGPYVFGRWRRADGVDLAPYPQYHLGKPRLDGIGVRFISDSSTVVNQIASGEIDAAFFVDAARIDALRAIPNHRIVVTPVPFAYTLDFNLKDPLVGDLAVRRALALAIDRRTIVQKVSHGVYVPDGLRALFTWAYDARAGNVPYAPGAAAAALERDGWLAGEDGIRAKGGRRLEIQLAEFTGSQEENVMATVIAAQERAVGIDVTRKRYTLQEFKMHTGPIYSGHYQIALEHQQLNWDPDPSTSLACNQWSPGGFNNAMYCNPAVDRAIAHATTVFDRPSRARDYSFIQRQMLKDLPYYFLCQVSEIDVIPTRLGGYDRPLLSPFNSIARWHYTN